jgi:hypothetical protein
MSIFQKELDALCVIIDLHVEFTKWWNKDCCSIVRGSGEGDDKLMGCWIQLGRRIRDRVLSSSKSHCKFRDVQRAQRGACSSHCIFIRWNCGSWELPKGITLGSLRGIARIEGK